MREWTFSFLLCKFTGFVKGDQKAEAGNFRWTSGSLKRPLSASKYPCITLTHIKIRRNLTYVWKHPCFISIKKRTQRIGLEYINNEYINNENKIKIGENIFMITRCKVLNKPCVQILVSNSILQKKEPGFLEK